MLLRQFFLKAESQLSEGGNLQIGDVEANRIDSTKRAQVVPIIDSALTAINAAFKQVNNNIPLWMPTLLKSKKFLAGSSFHFFNRLEISDADFSKVKRTVGDIDTQVDKNMGDQVRNWLGNLSPGTQIGPAQFVGMDAKDPAQVLTLWKFPDIVVVNDQGQETPITIQIDLELKPFTQGEPTKWAQFSASSDWNDLSQGIKGVFHKFIIRALTSLTVKTFLLRKIGVRKTTEKPTTDNMISFAVKSKEGGGLRSKYAPVIDSSTGQHEVKDGLPVYTEMPTSGYEQDISKIFTSIFGDKLDQSQLKSIEPKFWSFVGIVELMKEFLNPQEQEQIANSFNEIVFGKGAQRLYKDSLKQDLQEKNAAVDKMYEILGITPPAQLNNMILDYASGFKGKSAPVTEEVAASPRKGVVHLEKMKSLDFLDLLDQLKDEAGGKFRLNNIKMTVKIDGMGGRFGKDANGRPFYESSSSGPIQQSGAFSAFAQKRGFTDPVQIDRAKKYDNLFDDVMNMIPQIDKKYGPDFLKDVKVHCEFLYSPMASEEDGKLKFVSVAYNKLPQGVSLALVPLFVEVASTGQSHPDNDSIKQKLIGLGQIGNTMFVDNKLLHQGEMDITAIIQPLENIDELRAMLTSRKRDLISQADSAIQPIKDNLAKEIISNPNIIGKDKLGTDYEGIILYTNKGPVKVTSPHFKNIMAQKALAKLNKEPTDENIERTGKGDTAVIGWGRGMGHKGHMMLASSVITHAKELGGDPYFVVSRTFGPDDPLKPEEKLAIYRKVFPDRSHIFQTATDEIPDLTKVLRHLNQQGYRNATVVVGADQRSAFQYLTNYNNKPNKAGNIPYSFDELNVISRQETSDPSKEQEGPRATPMRQVLLDPTKSDEEQFAVWRDAMSPEISDEEVRDLMAKAKERMISLKPAPKTKSKTAMPKVTEPVAEKMLSKNSFAGYPKNKLGPAAHLTGKKKRPAKAGDLVGDAEESIYENEDVKTLQQKLNQLGAKIEVDGIMGPKTRAAMQRFMQQPSQTKTQQPAVPVSTSKKTTPTTSAPDKPITAVVRTGPGYADVKTSDGEIYRREGPRNWRNNNPGNIIKSPFATSKGAIGDDGKFAIFPTAQIGFTAKKDLLFSPNSKYINLSIQDAITKYAPPSENDTASYIRHVVNATKALPDTILNKLSDQQKDIMLQTINRLEGYKVGKIIPVDALSVAEDYDRIVKSLLENIIKNGY